MMKIEKKDSGLLLCCCLIFGLIFGQSAIAEETEGGLFDKNKNFFISGGLEMMNGDTTYKIGFPVTLPNGVEINGYFPFSELMWPLDIELAKINGGFKLGDDIVIKGGLKKNITDPDDNMEDSDWLTWYNPSRLDVYSESDISDFSALILDAEVNWTFLRNHNYAVYAGLGYQYQSFEFDGNLIRQYSPSGLRGYNYTGDGRVGITYEIEYHIPYLSIGMDFSIQENFVLSGEFGFSPYVIANDEDNHLLRENGGKVSEGDMDGYAVFLDVASRYNFMSNYFIELGGNLTRIDVEGSQDQRYVLAGAIGEVDMESTSDQFSVYLNVGINF